MDRSAGVEGEQRALQIDLREDLDPTLEERVEGEDLQAQGGLGGEVGLLAGIGFDVVELGAVLALLAVLDEGPVVLA